MAASSSSVPESPPQASVVIPRRSPRIAARRSASTHESAAQQSRLPKTKSRSIKPTRQRDQPTKAAAHSSGGTPSKKIKLQSNAGTTFEQEPKSSSHQLSGAHSLELQDKLSITSWEQLPAKLLAKVIPWTDSRAVESARNVCQTWRLNIDAFILLKESFTGDVLNNNV